MPVLLIVQHNTYHPLLPFIPKKLKPAVKLEQCCAVCGPKKKSSPTPLSTCARCGAVSYCGRDHQRADFDKHKHLCRYVLNCRTKMDTLAEQLSPEIFTENVGHFWQVLETRPFMSAKRDYMLALTATRTHMGVTLALEQGMECLRLCRTDNLGIRDAVPALMLMLDQRQKCYDFVKWWATFDPTGSANLLDRSIPMFTVKNANMAEAIPEGFFSRRSSVFHWAALAFIKIEAAFEAECAMDLKADADREMPGFMDMVMSFLTKASMSRLPNQVKRMKNDAADTMFMANELNKHYWPCVLDPHSLSGLKSPGFFQHGDVFEVQSWLIPHGLLWSQHPIYKDFVSLFLEGMASP